MFENVEQKFVFRTASISSKPLLTILIVILALMLLGLAGWYLFNASGSQPGYSVQIETTKTSQTGTDSENAKDFSESLKDFNFKLKDQFILRERVDVPASTVSTVKVNIPEGVKSVQFVIAAEKFVGNTLIDPKNVVNETISANSSISQEKYRTFFIENPMMGTWLVEFINRSPVDDSSSVVSVKVDDYVATVELDVNVVDSNVVSIAAMLKQDSESITATQIIAEIESQSQVSRRYVLYDDGQHEDGGASDGIFATKTDAFVPGGYFVVVRATLGQDDDEILSIDSVYIENTEVGR